MNLVIPKELATVLAIPVTPFDDSSMLDEAAYARVIERMLGAGIKVLVPGGNTSEYYALSDNEWRRSVQIAVERVPSDNVLVLPGVGRDIGMACTQATFAAQAGCRAVMVHQPLDPFLSGPGWLQYHKVLLDSVPEIAIVAYVRDPRVSQEDILRLLELERVVAVKYALPDPTAAAVLADRCGPSRSIVCGLAEMWAPSFTAAGCVGFTSGLANVVPEMSLNLHRLLAAGSYISARRLVSAIAPFEELRARDHSAYNVAVVKEALAELGVCGASVRPPASRLPEPDRSAVVHMTHRLVDERMALAQERRPEHELAGEVPA